MTDITETPLVVSGVASVKTKDKYDENKKIGLADAAAYTRAVNTVEELQDRFLGSAVHTLYSSDLTSGCIVETMVPTGSYSPGSVQVVALEEAIVSGKPIDLVDGRVPTRSIYDFPTDVREEYFHQILRAYRAVREGYEKHAHGDYTVLFTENAAQKVSDEQHRVARTISQPHTQVWVANGNTKPFDVQNVPRLLKHERKIISLLTSEVVRGLEALQNDYTTHNIEGIRFSVRAAPPHGYIIDTPITEEMSTADQARVLSQIMSVHHTRYVTEAERLTSSPNALAHTKLNSMLLPQPSYKVFGVFAKSGHLEISIAPTIIAGTGVVEALDRQIYRDPTNDAFFASPREEVMYYHEVSDKLAKTSDGV